MISTHEKNTKITAKHTRTYPYYYMCLPPILPQPTKTKWAKKNGGREKSTSRCVCALRTGKKAAERYIANGNIKNIFFFAGTRTNGRSRLVRLRSNRLSPRGYRHGGDSPDPSPRSGGGVAYSSCKPSTDVPFHRIPTFGLIPALVH